MMGRLSRSLAAITLLGAGSIMGCDGRLGAPLGAEGGPGAALPDLIQGLKARDPASRARSAVALGRMGPAAKEAVPALIAALKDRDLSVRAAAAYTLGQIGPDAKSAVPDLERLTRPSSLRDVAATAIQKIGH